MRRDKCRIAHTIRVNTTIIRINFFKMVTRMEFRMEFKGLKIIILKETLI